MSTTAQEVSVIWCDYGGVMTPPVAQAMGQVEAASGVPWRELAVAVDRVAMSRGQRGLGPLERGQISQLEWGRLVAAELPPEHQSAVDLGFWGDYWNRDRLPENTLLDELDRARTLGIRVGMLTNSVLEWEPFRAQLLAGRAEFDAAVRSHEIGLAKPDREIFEYAERMLPAGDGRALFIDDSESNCRAAIEHGWLAIHHVDAETTVAQIRELTGS